MPTSDIISHSQEIAGSPSSNVELPTWLANLRCPQCHSALTAEENGLACPACVESFPIIGGIPRMLLKPLREALLGGASASGDDARQVSTAQSFGYEWKRFSEMIDDWERNFREYMAPHPPEFFKGKRVLDAGSGKGRHAFYAAKYGADVWAIDLGEAAEVTRKNTAQHPNVHVAQADLYKPPFELESFDFVYSIGVLHHLPDPESAFKNLLRFVKPGGEIQIYLYWQPEGQPVKSAMLGAVTGVRRVTTKMPHSAVHALSYPAALTALVGFVWPYRMMRSLGLRRMAEKMPMKQYHSYPFRVCVNDQLDRFSAPIENRYTRAEVHGWLERAGLEDIQVLPNYGWLGTGRKPVK